MDLAIIRVAVSLGISDEKAEDLLTHFGDDAMRDALKSLQGRVATSFPEPIRDPYRYLKAILSGDQSKQVVEQVDPEQAAQAMVIESGKKKAEARTGWNEEWVKRQKAKVTEMLLQMSEEGVTELTNSLLEDLEQSNAHPSLIKRLQTSGWNHPLVKHLMINFYAKAALGEDWDKASSEDLLEIASETSS